MFLRLFTGLFLVVSPFDPECSSLSSSSKLAKSCYCSIRQCEGCLYDNATWRAESDHDMDLGLEMRESNPKFNRGPKVRLKD